jgi:elongation factor P
MPTLTAGDFRNGVTFEMDGKIMTVVEFQHVKPGKGAAFVRTKMKNVVTGAVTETSFNPTAKFEQAFVERKDAEYSYNDGDLYYFMDPETFDMTPLNRDVLGDGFRFVKENTTCKLLSYKGSVFGIEVPNFMDLEVTETEPGVRGDTATNVTKPATLETGTEIKVPLFINTGDKITVDTAPVSTCPAARTNCDIKGELLPFLTGFPRDTSREKRTQ